MIVDGYEILQEFNAHIIGPHMDVSGYRDGKFAFHYSVEGSREQSEKEIRFMLNQLSQCDVMRAAEC